MVDIGPVSQDRLDEVDSLYLRVGYSVKPAGGDTIIGAREGGKLVGAVRLAEENGLLVLRGMQVEKPFQKRGVGRKLLMAIGQVIGPRECWCVPYTHLRSFYGKIGFEDWPSSDAPGFLVKRLKGNKESGRQVTLMKRIANP